MVRAVDRRSDLRDTARDPGRGLVVNGANCFQPMLAVGGQLFLYQRRVDTVSPVAGHKLDFEAQASRHLAP